MRQERVEALLSITEVLYVMVMPINLYGWRVGLLVSSGLTSMLHIVSLLKNRRAGLDG